MRTDEQKRKHAESAKEYYRKNRDAVRAREKARYHANPDKVKSQSRAWVEAHKDHAKEYQRAYRLRNKASLSAYFKEHYRKNKDKIIARHGKEDAKRRASDLNYRIQRQLRCRVGQAIREQYGLKAASTMQLIGCTVAELRRHIESQFTPGMTWKNWGVRGWHIDHKLPCASFNLTDPEQQRACFSWKNLGPMWALDNIRKGKRLNSVPEPFSAPDPPFSSSLP